MGKTRANHTFDNGLVSNPAIFNNMKASRCYTRGNKPDTERQISDYLTHMWNL